MAKWKCGNCGWLYDEDLGDRSCGLMAGEAFMDLPEEFVCPVCGAAKLQFEQVEE